MKKLIKKSFVILLSLTTTFGSSAIPVYAETEEPETVKAELESREETETAIETNNYEETEYIYETENTEELREKNKEVENETNGEVDEATAGTMASGICGDNLTWVLDDSGNLSISGSGEMYNYEVVRWEDINTVGEVDTPWFEYRNEIVSISIASGVTTIGDYSFELCSNVVGVILPDSVTKIGWASFEECSSLENIILPDSITDMNILAFRNCSSLKMINIPKGVKEIGWKTFENCHGLLYIEIPDNVQIIDSGAFKGCSGLSEVIISEGVTTIFDEAFSWCTDLRYVLIPESVTNITGDPFEYSPTTMGTYKNSYAESYAIENSLSYESITIDAENIKLNYSNITLTKDNLTAALEAEIEPGHTTDKTVHWISSNPDVATVGYLDGIVQGISVGTATITATTANGKTATCQIDVQSVVEAESIGFVESEIVLNDEKTSASIQVNFTPENVADKNLQHMEWTSSDRDVVYVYGGTVSAVGTGTATVTGKTSNGKTATCKVTVEKSYPYRMVDGVRYYIASENEVEVTGFRAMSEREQVSYGPVDLKIPASITIDGKVYKVTSIRGYAFESSVNIASVTLEEGLESIGSYNLIGTYTSVTVPKSVKSLGFWAFRSSKLTSVVMLGDAPEAGSFGPGPGSGNGPFESYEGCEITISVPYGAKGYDKFPWTNYKVVYRNIQTYDVTYSANGGNSTPVPQKKNQGIDLKLSTEKPTKSYTLTYNANNGSVSNKTKSVSCTFKNWNTKADGKGTSYSAGANYMKDAPLTLYAQWSNPKAGTLAEPTRSGYSFDGWYTATNGGSKVTSGTTITKSMTLYAHWTKNKPQGPEKPQTEIEIFTTRLYKVCLGRTPDKAELKTWADLLETKEATGVSAAYGFVFSNEFKAKNLCNEDYVEQLYEAFMGRKADAAGKSTWVNLLESGTTREEVFNGFALSKEFEGLCNQYGIEQGKGIEIPKFGTIPTDSCSICGKEDGVTGFVTRLYQVCLNRKPDAGGLKDWRTRLCEHTSSGREVAYGFIFSQEFINKKYSNADYVEHLYEAFMGRGSDAAGKKMWVDLLNTGWTREQVFDGFVGSQEFTGICNSYGIVRD